MYLSADAALRLLCPTTNISWDSQNAGAQQGACLDSDFHSHKLPLRPTRCGVVLLRVLQQHLSSPGSSPRCSDQDLLTCADSFCTCGPCECCSRPSARSRSPAASLAGSELCQRLEIDGSSVGFSTHTHHIFLMLFCGFRTVAW